MPKRTKREKLLAQSRRHTVTTLPSSSQVASADTQEQHPAFTYQITNTPAQKEQMKDANTEELPIIRHDLVKTVILALCAIGIELTVYTLLRGK